MTVGRRGGRTITVDGMKLRWWFRLPSCGTADCPQDWSHVVIADASRAGSVVRWLVPSFSGPVTPARVAAAARAALRDGWRPGQGSGERRCLLPQPPEQVS